MVLHVTLSCLGRYLAVPAAVGALHSFPLVQVFGLTVDPGVEFFHFTWMNLIKFKTFGFIIHQCDAKNESASIFHADQKGTGIFLYHRSSAKNSGFSKEF